LAGAGEGTEGVFFLDTKNSVSGSKGDSTVESKAQDDFLNEYARTRLIEWCAQELLEGKLDLTSQPPLLIEAALEKGWLTKREPRSLTAKGYTTAAAFLRS
jgi:hypothetical protein